MRAKIVAAMVRKIGDAVYAAWMEELLERGVDAEGAHLQATALTDVRMELLRQAWVTVDSLPIPSITPAQIAHEEDCQVRLRRLLRRG